MIQVSGLKKSFGGRVLFEDLNFSISKNEVVGFVGRNGCGKSTLFKMILGKEDYDSGQISVPKNYTLGYLDQHIHFTEATVLLECCQVLKGDEQWDYYKAEKILFGLGFSEEDLHKDPHSFSGGFQLRINLTKCLLEKPDLLLLDEPTNYLDLVSIRWMKGFLKSYSGEVIIITHDRSFMDSVSTHTMGLHRGKLIKISGGTEKYYEQWALEEEIYEKSKEKIDKKIQHMKKFVDRFRAKASKASQAQSKLKQIEKMQVLEDLQEESDMGLQFQYKEIPAKTFMRVKDLSFSFKPEEFFLFRDLSFELKKGDRVAVIGKNGKGKSTLLNVLASDLEALTGTMDFHPDVSLGYYQQTHKKDLLPKNTIVDEIEQANPLLSISQVRAICGAMMFSGDDAKKKISVLSGGEQGRVLLGKILANPCNLLLLDEPTNHLDMYSIDVLIDEIASFPGAVIMVTHSEEMLRKLANKLIIFSEGRAQFFEGSYDDFLEKIGWEDEIPLKKENKALKVQEEKLRQSKDKSREEKKLQKKVEALEKKIQDLEEDLKKENDLLLKKVEEGGRKLEIADISKKIKSIQDDIEVAFEKLELLSNELDQMSG